MSEPLRWSAACFALWVVGCAAAQVDDSPASDGSGAASSSGSSSDPGAAGTGGTTHAGNGSGSASGGTSAKAGASSGAGAGAVGGAAASAGTGGGSAASGSGGGGTPPAKPANTDLPFSEDFEDGEANGFIPWNEDLTAGTWAIVDDAAGKIYQPQAAVSDLEFAVGGSTAWADVTLTVKVRLNDSDSGAQILLRMKEPKTYLVVEMAEGKYKLRGRSNGSTQDLVAPSPKPVITAGTWYTVGITAKGTAVELTLDGTSIGTASAQADISNGGIALGADEGSVSFDDVSVIAAP